MKKLLLLTALAISNLTLILSSHLIFGQDYTVTTYVGGDSEQVFRSPSKIVFGEGGVMYVADKSDHKIKKVDLNGNVSDYIGSGMEGGSDGIGKQAQLSFPTSLAIDPDGYLYVAEFFGRIRRISPNGSVETIFSSIGSVFITSIIVDKEGNVFFSDVYKGSRIFKMFPSKQNYFEVYAGSSSVLSSDIDGYRLDSRFGYISNMFIDDDGGILVAGGNKVKKIDQLGVVNTLFEINNPIGIAKNRLGQLIISSTIGKVYKVEQNGNVISIAGGQTGDVDGDGVSSRFSRPKDLVIYEDVIYVVDQGNRKIKRITTSDWDDDGYSVTEGDCDDFNPLISPGVFEIGCNGVDENCNGFIDELEVPRNQVSINVITKTYGDDDFILDTERSNKTINYTSDNHNVAIVRNGLIHIVSAGKAVINASSDDRLSLNFILKVLKKDLYIIPKVAIKTKGYDNPNFELQYLGLVDDRDFIGIEPPVISTIATTESDVGTYSIELAGGNSQNYNMILNNGQLVISPLSVDCETYIKKWSVDKEYSKGEQITLDEVVYEALWWNKGENPLNSSAWKQIKEDGDISWSANIVYNLGDIVKYNDNFYTAKWWTKSENPEINKSGVWEVFVNKQERSFSLLNEREKLDEVLVFPNPSNGQIHIQNNEIIDSVLLYDLQGSLVKQFDVNKSYIKMDLKNLSSSIYTLKIILENDFVTRKIIIKNQ